MRSSLLRSTLSPDMGDDLPFQIYTALETDAETLLTFSFRQQYMPSISQAPKTGTLAMEC